MKKIVLILIGVCCCQLLLAQQQAIKITNINTNKEKIIQENNRIKLKTFDGRTIKGRFQIANNRSIVIDSIQIDLSEIDALKRNPLLTFILTSGVLIYGGALTAGFGVLIGVLVDTSAFWLTIPAAGMIYAGIKSPNFNKNHKTEKGWSFEIITLPD